MANRPRLRHRIRDARLAEPVARVFADGLGRFVPEDAAADDPRRIVSARLCPVPAQGPSAPFDALYPHAELFLAACLTVAVVDGTYSVEDARLVSAFAHRLGMSARQLAALEHRVFGELRQRGADRMAREQAAQVLEDSDTVEADKTMPGGLTTVFAAGRPYEG